MNEYDRGSRVAVHSILTKVARGTLDVSAAKLPSSFVFHPWNKPEDSSLRFLTGPTIRIITLPQEAEPVEPTIIPTRSRAFQERMEYQFRQYRGLRYRKLLTPEWKRFGKRYELEIADYIKKSHTKPVRIPVYELVS